MYLRGKTREQLDTALAHKSRAELIDLICAALRFDGSVGEGNGETSIGDAHPTCALSNTATIMRDFISDYGVWSSGTSHSRLSDRR